MPLVYLFMHRPASKDLNAFMETHMTKKSDAEQEALDKLMDMKKTEVPAEDLKEYHFQKAMKSIRSIGISSYFSNETIATEHLSYAPIPGKYVGCMPVSEVGNAWAI